MSDDPIESMAPHLAAPVTRDPAQSSTEDDGGTELSMPIAPPIIFADDE